MAIGQELLNVPMGDMIRQMAFAIADAQVKLDSSSIEVAEMMGGLKVIEDDEGNQTFDDSRVFFGYELMTAKDALAYIAADDAMTGGDTTALTKLIDDQKKSLPSGEKDTGLIRVPTRVSMLELGFSPTFYQFVDTIIEVKIAIKITREIERSRTTRDTANSSSTAKSTRAKFKLFGGAGARFGSNTKSQATTSQVDATYAAKYSYSAEGSSLLRTKLVPLPPPPILEERIRRQMDEEAERRRLVLEKRLGTTPSPTPTP